MALIVSKLTFQKNLFSFYSKAIQCYQDKIINNPHSIGADELMDILFSYGIRMFFDVDFIKTSRKYFHDDFEPHILIETINPQSEMQLHDYQMGILYYDEVNEKYIWVGSTGLLVERTFEDKAEALYTFTQELKYQILSVQLVIDRVDKHRLLIMNFHDDRYGDTYALLHYLNYTILEDIWDSEKNKKCSMGLAKRFMKSKLANLNLHVSKWNQAWLIDYYKMYTHLDVNTLSLENFYTIMKDTKDLCYPKTKEPVFPRFDIHHEAILMNTLNDAELYGDYQGELSQYFMVLYPYMPFQEWNIENARYLLTSGQKIREVLQTHLGVPMEDTFSLENLQKIQIPKHKYLEIIKELPPSLRYIFYDNTKVIFERLAKDMEFIGNMFAHVDPELQKKLNIHSQIWNLNVDKWLSMHPFGTCQIKGGEYFEGILKGQLNRQGYTPKENETLQDMYTTLTHFVKLNDYMKEPTLLNVIFNVSHKKISAALWIKHILMHPQEFSLEDLKKYKPIIKNERLGSILNSSVFQQIIERNSFDIDNEETKDNHPTGTL